MTRAIAITAVVAAIVGLSACAKEEPPPPPTTTYTSTYTK